MKPTDLPARIAARIRLDPETGCWVWTGAVTRSGYGYVGWQGGKRVTHRFAYELLVAAIPDGLVLDHRCGVKRCCNPLHLDPVTQQENMRRAGLQRRQETCNKGHPLSGDNLYQRTTGFTAGRRGDCRQCSLEHSREYRQKHLQAIRAYDRKRGHRHGRKKGTRPGPGQMPLG